MTSSDDAPRRRNKVEDLLGHLPPDPERERRQAMLSGGLHVTCTSGEGVSIVWPQVAGLMRQGEDMLTIVSPFCLVTLHGRGVASLREPIIGQRLGELVEGAEVRGVLIDSIEIDWNTAMVPPAPRQEQAPEPPRKPTEEQEG